MTTEPYTPDEAGARLAYVDGLFASGTRNIKEQREELRAEFDRFVAKIKADAWDEGQEAGWNEAKECWAVEGMVGDFHKHSNVPNTYRIEEEA